VSIGTAGAGESTAQAFARIFASDVGDEAKMGLFIAELIDKNSREYVEFVQPLIEDMQGEIEERRAALAGVRDRVQRLVSGQYMPTPAAIIAELWSCDGPPESRDGK
jgi:hypothetical protein